MKRHTFSMHVNEGEMSVFRKGLGQIWVELTNFLDLREIKNFSLWNVDQIIFGYYETQDDFMLSESDKKQIDGWEQVYGKSYTWISSPYQEMRLMYHDYGVVRENKELIRHRVFITKLAEGMEEEYKARHDVLVKERGDRITQGPDSNFSIWYAGGYIFGYKEIDTTMECEMTAEEKNNTINWETRMLEIMTWLTNDVDWITGECNPSIHRLGWHN